jgi:ABC-type antimicrobial peptide transport system permease subunit
MGVSEIDPFHRIVIKAKRQIGPPSQAINDKRFLFVDWRGLHPELSVLMSFNDGLMNFLLICMSLVAFVSITTPVHILWEDRLPELKTLFTLGGTRSVLVKIGLSEALIVTFLSLLLTFILFSPIYKLARHFGIDFTYLGEGKMIKDGIELSPVVYPVLTLQHVLNVTLFNFSVIFGANFWCLSKRIRSLGAES